jgi:ferredoxin--NADP+ reductase
MRSIRFRFLETPLRIAGDRRVSSLLLAKNTLEGPPFEQTAVAGASTFDLDCGVVFRSIGYKGVALPGIGFDDGTGTIPNDKGRCLNGHAPARGLYVTGWIKRGATGVIGTNRADSVETVESVFEDLAQVAPVERPGSSGLKAALTARDVRIITYAEWQVIDAFERKRGEPRGKPREKFTKIPEMMECLRADCCKPAASPADLSNGVKLVKTHS